MTVELHHTEAGQGVPLVLLHAFPLSSAMWAAQREGLADVCRVITPDQRGLGASPLGSGPPSLDAVAHDVAALLDRLGLDRVILGGLSMGGYVTMAFLRRYPDRVAGLVLADTRAGADPPEGVLRRERLAERVTGDEGIDAVFTEVVPNLFGPSTVEGRPEVVRRVHDLVRAAEPAAVAWASRAMAVRPDSAGVLAATDVPALVLVGEEDRLTPVADAEAMVHVLPRARLVRLPAAGHLSAIEDPEAFNAAVREFVADLG
jgi:pimeloyl-ACP methyl ester carboxylesterase